MREAKKNNMREPEEYNMSEAKDEKIRGRKHE